MQGASIALVATMKSTDMSVAMKIAPPLFTMINTVMNVNVLLPSNDLKYIRLVLIANGSVRARQLAEEIGEIMSKGSGRRPEDKSKFDDNFDKIFSKPEKKKKAYKTKPDYPPIKKERLV